MVLQLLLKHWKKVGIGVLVAIIIALSSTVYLQRNKIKSTMALYSVEANNVKALEEGVKHWKDEAGRNNSKSRVLLYTKDHVEQSRDSDITALRNIIKQQGSKLKNVTNIGYIKTRIDTVLRDTVVKFAIRDTSVDLSTPDIHNIVTFKGGYVSSEIGIHNTQYLVTEHHKELIKPKKKFFLCRFIQNIFGKKQIVLNQQIINTNKLIETTDQKFINIIK